MVRRSASYQFLTQRRPDELRPRISPTAKSFYDSARARLDRECRYGFRYAALADADGYDDMRFVTLMHLAGELVSDAPYWLTRKEVGDMLAVIMMQLAGETVSDVPTALADADGDDDMRV